MKGGAALVLAALVVVAACVSAPVPPSPTVPAAAPPAAPPTAPQAAPPAPRAAALAVAIVDRSQQLLRGAFSYQNRETVPVAARIRVSPPDQAGVVSVTGAAGAIPAGSRTFRRTHVRITSIDWGDDTCVPYEQDGSFSASVRAGPGTTIVVDVTSSDQCKRFRPTSSAAAILRVTEGVDATAASAPFRVSGAQGDWHWVASGELFGGAPHLQFTLPEGPRPDCRVPRLYLYRLFDAQGQYVTQVNVNVHGPVLTPTGLPIESGDGHNNYWSVFKPAPAQQCLAPGRRYELAGWTSGLEPGWYRARVVLVLLQPDGVERDTTLPVEHPAHQERGIEGNTGTGYLPFARVGEAATPQLPATLLNDGASWGSGGTRGIVAAEDRGRFALGSRVATQTDFIASPRDPLSGRRVTYVLEPFLPTLAYTGFDHVVPQVPLLALDESAPGRVSVTLGKPDGRTADLAKDAPIAQSFISGSHHTAYQVDTSFAGPGRTYGITTGLPSLAVQFDQYGLHRVTLSGSLRTLWGQELRLRGTYEIWVAEPLELSLGTFQGTPLAVGEEHSPVVTVHPGVPADIEVRVDHYVDGDAAKKQSYRAAGKANRFGYFVAKDAWKPGAHGEYVARVMASWTDPVDGTLWMGARAGASIVATPNTPLIAHGERNGRLAALARDNTLRTWFFTRTFDPACGEVACEEIVKQEARTVGNFPFFRGDVAWITDFSPIGPSITLEDPAGVLDRLAPHVARAFAWCGAGYCADATDMKRLSIRTSAGRGASGRPAAIDSWAYFYNSTIHADGVNVHHSAEEIHSAHHHWYGTDTYNCQIGLACYKAWDQPGPKRGVGIDRQGDEEGDVKVMFGGAVVKARGEAHFVPYASMAVIVPEGVWGPGNTFVHRDAKGQRVCPPYQGAAGGLATCGPLLTLRGRPVDLFVTPTGTRPGSVLEVGDTFVFSGQAWPTLDTAVAVTLTSPSGKEQRFAGRASAVGHIDSSGKTLTVSEPGVWTVHVALTQDRPVPSTGLAPKPALVADGKTVLKEHGYGTPLSAILGSLDSTYRFVVAEPRAEVAVSTEITLRRGPQTGALVPAIALSFTPLPGAASLRYFVGRQGLIVRDEAVSGSGPVRIELQTGQLDQEGYTNVVLGAASLEIVLAGTLGGRWFAKTVNLRGLTPLGAGPATLR